MAGGDEGCDFWTEKCVPVTDGLNGLDQVFGAGVFEDIACGACFKGAPKMLFIRIHAEDQHPGSFGGGDLASHVDTAAAGQREIHDRDARLKLLNLDDSFFAAGGFANNLTSSSIMQIDQSLNY